METEEEVELEDIGEGMMISLYVTCWLFWGELVDLGV